MILSSNIDYDGSDLPNLGIYTDDTLNQILSKIELIFDNNLVTAGNNISVTRLGNQYKVATTLPNITQASIDRWDLDGDGVFDPSPSSPTGATVDAYNFNYTKVGNTIHFSGYIEATDLNASGSNIIELEIPETYFPDEIYGINGGFNIRQSNPPLGTNIIISSQNGKCIIEIELPTGTSLNFSIFGDYRSSAIQVFSSQFTQQFT